MNVAIIGNGMAGAAAAEELLRVRPDIRLTLFGDEPHPNYNRILLSDVLAGKQSSEEIVLNPLSWYADRGIDLRIGTRIAAIDPKGQTVTDAGGNTFPYDRLLLAMGGRPVLPPIDGLDRPGVFVFRSLEDCASILRQAKEAKEAVVIGGGLLGLEAARGLLNHGVDVTVVHKMAVLMEQQLDPIGGSLLKREMERMGLRILLEAETKAIIGSPEGEVAGVRLSDGQTLSARMVLVCTGYRPNIELAQAAGLPTRRGVVVDDRMQTADPHIFAVGDLAEHRGIVYGLIAPIREQVRTAAAAMVGDGKLRYEGTSCATILKVAGVHLTSAGRIHVGPGDEELAYFDSQGGIYKKLILQNRRIKGMILLGDNREGQRLFGLLQSGTDVTDIKHRLLAEGVGAVEPSMSGAAALADADIVCNCHSVTKGTILTAIREKGLKSRGEVAAATQASTGCGSCASLLEDLLKAPAGPAPSSVVEKTAAGKTVPLPPPPGPIRVGIPIAPPKGLEIERIKQEGLGLDWSRIRTHGALALGPDDYYRLKVYGVCTQKHTGYFMVRIRIPGGRLSAEQIDVLADLAETHGRGWGHLTVRQDLELHWVRVEEMPEIWERLEAVGLSTRSACGHTLRNVSACPHGESSPDGLIDVQPLTRAITDYFIERSDLLNAAMPNRLNLFFAGCPRCAPEAQINDIGFVAVERRDRAGVARIGFELWVGGSLGSHPVVGYKIKAFLLPGETLAACQAIFQLHTRYGNRQKGKSRLKYLIERWGREKFTEQFDRLFQEKQTLPENRPFQLQMANGGRRIGRWKRFFAAAQQQRGYLRAEIAVPMGEIRAEQLRELSRLSRRFGRGEVYFTQGQDVELPWVHPRRIDRLGRFLQEVGLRLKGGEPKILACPGTEFCVLAVTNAQGAARGLLSRLGKNDPAKQALLSDVSIHVSGCPNSCAKHQVADIGLAGSMGTVGEDRRYAYLLFLGGRMEGGVRLGEMVRKGITEEEVLPTMEALLEIVLAQRHPGEAFVECVDRIGPMAIAKELELRLAPRRPRPDLRVPMRIEDALKIK